MAANEERGEFALNLDGASYTLRPSYEAILAFEAETGKGLMELARTALGGASSLTEVATVATHCIRAWGKEAGNTNAAGVNGQRVGGLIMESEGGISHAMTVIGSMLAMAATGGINAKGEVKAAAETTMSQKTGSQSDAA